MRAVQECSCSMDLTTSLAEPREGARWREGMTLAHAVLALRACNRSASRSEAVHQVSGHRVLSAKAHKTVAACLPLCPALRRSKAPYAARARSPGHLQDHHRVATASPSFSLPSPDRSSPHLFYGKIARSISQQVDTLSKSKD